MAQQLRATAEKVIQDAIQAVRSEILRLLLTATEQKHPFQEAAGRGANQFEYRPLSLIIAQLDKVARDRVFAAVYAKFRDVWRAQALPAACQMYNGLGVPPIVSGFIIHYVGQDHITIGWHASPCGECNNMHELNVATMVDDLDAVQRTCDVFQTK